MSSHLAAGATVSEAVTIPHPVMKTRRLHLKAHNSYSWKCHIPTMTHLQQWGVFAALSPSPERGKPSYGPRRTCPHHPELPAVRETPLQHHPTQPVPDPPSSSSEQMLSAAFSSGLKNYPSQVNFSDPVSYPTAVVTPSVKVTQIQGT